jgi:hypothetical protein
MINIFIDIPNLLKHQSQVAKGVFVGYHLTIKSNIPLLLHGSTEITLHILYFRPTMCFRSRDASVSLEPVVQGPVGGSAEAARDGVDDAARAVAERFEREPEDT